MNKEKTVQTNEQKETALKEQLESMFIEILKIKELQKFILVGMGVDLESLKEF